MLKKITGAEYPLNKIFSSDFDYSIPAYQRPYAWTTEHAGVLLSDLFEFFDKEKEDSYFLGSIVLVKEESKPHAEVIDGQQRLTTLTILLAALTHLATGKIRDNFSHYLCEPGNELAGLVQKPRLALRERDRIYFKSMVQDVNFESLLQSDPMQLDNDSQRNIQSNTKLFVDKLKGKFDGDEERLKAFGTFLVQRCFLVAVSTPNPQSAFRVFSVMNSRGLDLLPTDMIKAKLIGQVLPTRREPLNETWENLEVSTGREGFAEVFGHIRMIFAKEKARRSLLEEFEEKVIKLNPDAEALINTVVEPYAQAFVTVKDSSFRSSANAQDVNQLLTWLNRIENKDWVPPAIRFFMKHEDDSPYVLWFTKRLERLAACLLICGYDVNQRIDRYAKVLKGLEENDSLQLPVSAVELSAEEKKSFRESLDGEIYLMPAQRRNYVVLRLDSFVADGAATYDLEKLTLEHVLPQTPAAGSDWLTSWATQEARDKWVHRLANLVPLNRRRNSKALNYDFGKKKESYFGGADNVTSYALTTQVMSESSWTPQTVEIRQTTLLATLFKKWDL